MTISFDQPLRQARDQFEREYLEHHLKQNGWKLSRHVAEISGFSRCYLYRLAHKLGIFKECAALQRSAATVDDRSATGGERPAL